MTEKYMKKLLKNVYQISPSNREKVFLKKYEKRSMRILDVFILEFKYMGMQSVLSGAILIILFGIISFSKNSELMWYVSGILPVVGLILMSGMGKSEKYGMHELEAASRFSLRFIKATRIFILGSATLGIVVVLAAGLALFFILGNHQTNDSINVAVDEPYVAEVYDSMYAL